MLKPVKVKFRAVCTDAVAANENSPQNVIKVVTGLDMLAVKCPIQDEGVFASIVADLKQTGGALEVDVEGFVVGQKNATQINGSNIAFGRLQIDCIDARPARPAAPGETPEAEPATGRRR